MGSKSPWIKLGVLILVIISFIVFKKFNKKSEGFNTSTITTIEIFAGTGSAGNSNGNPPTSASFRGPGGMCFDSTGNMYVCDKLNHCIRKIDSAGNVSTFAGSGTSGDVNDTGTAASFNRPSGIAADSSNNLYVADLYNNRIRKITPEGLVTTFAGDGTNVDKNGIGTAAGISSPDGIAIDSSNNLYVVQLGANRRTIRKITLGGAVTSIQVVSTTDTNYVNSNGGANCIAIDSSNNIYLSIVYGIIKVTPSGTYSTFVGSYGYADGLGASAKFAMINSITIDTSNNLYVSDQINRRIRKITPAGVVSTVAGNGTMGNIMVTAAQASAGTLVTSTACIYAANAIVWKNNNIYVSELSINGIKLIKQTIVCTAGNYLSGSSCVLCPLGTFQNSPTFIGTSCTSCAAGTYASGTGRSGCTACPAVLASTRITSPVGASNVSQCTVTECTAGYYVNNGTTCSQVPRNGAVNSAGNGFVCNSNYYNNGTGSCTGLPANATQSSSGTGFTCAAGYRQGATSCTQCGVGKFSEAGAITCADCATGTYSAAGSASCTTLPTGATASSSGTGFTCAAGYSQSTTACTTCGVGTYSGAGAGSCTSCGTSKYTTGTGSTSISACLNLPSNADINPSGGFTCRTGFYSNGTACVQVPPNSDRNSSGTGFTCRSGYSQGTTACTQCGASTYSTAGEASCAACATGTYSAAGAASCRPLPSNAIATNTGNGFTCAPGFYNNGTGCTALPSNASANSSGTGFTCAAGYSQSLTACTQCGIGSYSEAGANNCSACGTNKYTTSPGSTSISACLSVPLNGTLNSAGNGFVCNSNYYNNGNGSCIAVPSNATANSSGTGFTCAAGYSQGETSCAQCGVGKFSEAGALTCTDCATGTYSAAGAASCAQLPTGATASSSGPGFTCGSGFSQGTSSCTQCGVGTYSAAGAASCTTCTLTTGVSGTTSAAGSSSQSNCTATSCQPGYGFAAGNCTRCGAGFFGSGGTTQCVACSGGKTSPAGSSDANQCVCPTGQVSVTLNGVTKCVVNCANTNLPQRTQGSLNATLFSIQTCRPGGQNVYNYTLGSNVTTTNPCTGQAFYDFDKQSCVNALGIEVSATSLNTCDNNSVYSQQTNACVPVRVIVKPGDPQLKNTIGQPGTSDYRNCKTTDQGDCTLIFNDGNGNYTTTNPCTVSGKLYNFNTKTCSIAINPCCRFTSPAAAAAGGCVNNTRTISTKNPVKCPPGSKVLCCNQAYSTNRSCQVQGFWSNILQFTANHNATCASGFMDFGDQIDTIAQKRAKRLLKI